MSLKEAFLTPKSIICFRLKGRMQLENDWTFELESDNQIEKFKVTQRVNDKGWNLSYEVKLK